MTDFHRTSVDNRSFVRGAARILIADASVTRPTQIAHVIHLASSSGVALYDAVTVASASAALGWTDLGATKTGVQISINNAEETFDVDQIYGDISSAPTSWECTVGTQLAEMTPEKMQIAWEGSAISVDAGPTIPEQEFGFGQPTSYTAKRLAILFQRPNGKIRAYLFHKVQRMPQESSVTHAKTGEQISIPVRWRCLADTTITDPYKRYFIIRDQSTPASP